ncbi:putative HIRAN domain-containing protein [Heracleum sosnowskyi]|uniref:HIRAN domain-containing protein n=1 Tax=Heracleum sosnowskyi TaxID=360622 RepID=A0AAD8M516_9APIA|nr:putative HIRAN domain-containing protein [Heracleum sosnowskyi]
MLPTARRKRLRLTSKTYPMFAYISVADFGLVNYLLQGYYEGKVEAYWCEEVERELVACGEIGRLPMEWGKCLIPLGNSNKVKVLCRCIAVPTNLQLMQEILLYGSFYIHRSLFTEVTNSSWKLDAPSNIDSTIYPLLTLFKLLKIKPYQEADFTPEEFNQENMVSTRGE